MNIITGNKKLACAAIFFAAAAGVTACKPYDGPAPEVPSGPGDTASESPATTESSAPTTAESSAPTTAESSAPTTAAGSAPTTAESDVVEVDNQITLVEDQLPKQAE